LPLYDAKKRKISENGTMEDSGIVLESSGGLRKKAL